MNKEDFFREAIKNRAYLRIKWVKTLFGIYTKTDKGSELPYQIDHKDGKVYYLSKEGKWEVITDAKVNTPLFVPLDPFTITENELSIVKGSIKTTIGNIVVNAILLEEGLSGKLPFVTGRIKSKDIEKEILARLVDNVPEDKRTKDNIYVDEYLHFGFCTKAIDALAVVSVPALSEKAVQGHPDRHKLKKELLTKYEGRLSDPIVIATIDKAFEDLDRSWIKGDISEGLYTKDKAYKITRKRLYYQYGAERSIDGDELKLISNALADGWSPEDMPLLVNTLRQGIAARGSETALGGVAFKDALRIIGPVKVSEEDCKSVMTLPIAVEEYNYRDLVGFYTLDTSKKPKVVDEAIAKSFLNKVINIRHPAYCLTANGNFCKRCVGDEVAKFPDSLGELASDIGSTHLGNFMSLMHGTSLDVVTYNPIGSLA